MVLGQADSETPQRGLVDPFRFECCFKIEIM
jgi:hypothetical protein